MSRELVRYAMGEASEQEQPQIQTPQFIEEKEKEDGKSMVSEQSGSGKTDSGS